MRDSDGVEPRLRATMYFTYGRRKRPEVTASTTFDAILRLERTSTTRYAAWPGHDRWRRVRPGDLVEFFADKAMEGRSLTVRVTRVGEIDLASCDEATLDEWSRAEGWLPEVGRESGRRLGRAVWVRYELADPAPEARTAPGGGQMAFGF